MSEMHINSRMFGSLKKIMVNKSLDAGTLRGKVNAQNIANINTNGYKRQEVSFEKELRQALKLKTKGANTNSNHIEISKKARVKKVNAFSYKPYDNTNSSGINNVDIDTENAKVAENQIFYNYGVKFSSFKKLQASITGRPL